MPSRYFSNSQASRLLPIPAWPMSDTRRSRFSRAGGVERSLRRRSSSSRPTNGGSRLPCAPGRRARRRRGARATPGPARPCPSGLLAGRLEGDRDVRGHGTSPRRRAPCRVRLRTGAGTRYSRGRLRPCPGSGADGDGGFAREHAGSRLDARAELAHAVDQLQGCANRTLGIVLRVVGAPQTAITASPMNFSTVPSSSRDHVAREVESASAVSRVLRSRSSANGVNPTRSANRTDTSFRSATGPPGSRLPRQQRHHGAHALSHGCAHADTDPAPLDGSRLPSRQRVSLRTCRPTAVQPRAAPSPQEALAQASSEPPELGDPLRPSAPALAARIRCVSVSGSAAPQGTAS